MSKRTVNPLLPQYRHAKCIGIPRSKFDGRGTAPPECMCYRWRYCWRQTPAPCGFDAAASFVDDALGFLIRVLASDWGSMALARDRVTYTNCNSRAPEGIAAQLPSAPKQPS